ncbi:type II toxin-antitoxin system RelE/ParE family toxin [Pseudoxanthomonas sp.]|uniref:type II toxin-antitoxin system RelE/ParE family toxin n=1 Tax=Pseudoxanthomonas sp. TaxID=1871049 RepID=UPI00258FEB0B|nr:type II toxin-antitoxin system RelE/ParE family toxin [Pseudoxanthomonas sp.]MCR6685334.1 type II toxin-antitoxin system RelE/ParE family toxin [Pseudoxanthomonas sp.]
MVEVRQTETFRDWIAVLRDRSAAAIIRRRIDRVSGGNLGDVKFFDRIGELRIDLGPGYRVYFVKRSNALIVLLCGGDKGSQRGDIELAKKLAANL